MRAVRIAEQLIVLGGLLLVGLAATPLGHELVDEAGRNLASPDIITDYTYALLWAVALAPTIWLWPAPRGDRRALLWLWAAKVEVALGFMLYYEWNYGLDAVGYFWQGEPSRYGAAEVAFGNGTEIMSWLSNLHWRFLVADSYHAMKITFGYIGLCGVYAFYRAACAAVHKESVVVLYMIGLFPSTLQWSGILGKDPITFLGIGLYCWGVARYSAYGALGGVALAGAGFLIAASMRPWLAMILLAPLSAFLLLRMKRPGLRLLLIVLAPFAFVGGLSLFADRLQVASVDDVVARTQTIAETFAQGGSANATELASENTPMKMLLFAPLGMFSALFRPLPGEVLNPFGLLAGLENAVLLFFAVRALRRGVRRRLRDEPLLLFALALVLCWSLVYGYVSMLNLGTGARFRLQVSPILLCLVVYLSRPKAASV